MSITHNYDQLNKDHCKEYLIDICHTGR